MAEEVSMNKTPVIILPMNPVRECSVADNENTELENKNSNIVQSTEGNTFSVDEDVQNLVDNLDVNCNLNDSSKEADMLQHPNVNANNKARVHKITEEQLLGDAKCSSGISLQQIFVVPSDCDLVALEKILLDFGAEKVEVEDYKEEYFDTEDYQLTLANIFLKRCGDCWEFKFPKTHFDTEDKEQSGKSCDSSEESEEISSIDKILQLLTKQLGVESCSKVQETGCKLEKFVNDRLHCISCTCIAKTKYCKGNTTVIFQQAKDRFSVADFLVKVRDSDSLTDAIAQIRDLATQLGLRPMGDVDLTELSQSTCGDHSSA